MYSKLHLLYNGIAEFKIVSLEWKRLHVFMASYRLFCSVLVDVFISY